jgi:hypothetical protein
MTLAQETTAMLIGQALSAFGSCKRSHLDFFQWDLDVLT